MTALNYMTRVPLDVTATRSTDGAGQNTVHVRLHNADQPGRLLRTGGGHRGPRR